MNPGSVETSVLWLTPDKHTDISVGRRRIAEHLSEEGYSITLRAATPRSLFRSLREADAFDIVIGTTRAGAIGGALLSLVTGKPLIVDHIDPIRQFEENNPRLLAAIVRRLEDVSFRVADNVLYVYPEEELRVRRAGIATKTDLGVDFDRFANPPTNVVERAEAELGQYDNIAIYVGGLEPIYRIQELLAAVNELEGWTLVVLGAGSLAGLVEERAEQGDVVFPGTVDHEFVPGYLHAADVGICLVDDPYTLKVLEYGAAGLPTVHVRGRAETRLEGLVEFCDPDPVSIARAIERAASTDPTTLRSFAREFDWAEIAKTYERIIKTVK